VVLVGNGTVLKLSKEKIDKERDSKLFERLSTWLQSTEGAMMAKKLKDVDFLSKVPQELLSLVARLFSSQILPKGN
jgi:hypothetical protein